MAIFKGSKEAVAGAEGESVNECMKVGQALVEGGQLTPENLAQALGQANGDLLQFADIALSRYSVGRTEIAIAISAATKKAAVRIKAATIAISPSKAPNE